MRHIGWGKRGWSLVCSVLDPNHHIGSTRSDRRGRGVNFEFGPHTKKCLANQYAYLSLKQLEDAAPPFSIGVEDVLGDFNRAALPQRDNAVVNK